MNQSVVTSNVEGRIARITLNRPDKRNALSGNVVDALQAAFDAVGSDPQVRVIILTGEGKAFSAGADLQAIKDLQVATEAENLADSSRLAKLFETIYRCPKPVIARVNGHAIAGGCGLASVCDFSIVTKHAKLGFTEVRIGFVPAIVMVFVLRKLGELAARELFLRGHLIDAQKAQQMGLISQVVAEDELDEAVEALALELSKQTSGSAVAITKQMLAEVPGKTLEEALDYAARKNAEARATEDCQAGIAAFLGKRPMPWLND